MSVRDEAIGAAVAMALEEPTDSDLAEAVRGELDNLWNDLNDAVRNAINGVWPMACDHLTWRIIRLSRIVGSTPWESIQVGLLTSGIYQRIHEAAGIDYAPVDMERAQELASRFLPGPLARGREDTGAVRHSSPPR